MSTTNSVGTDYSGIGLNRPPKEDTGPKKELGQAEFMKLLTTQLQHQDPFKPLDNAEFVAQMAQFSALEGQQKMLASFNTMANALTSNQALQASAIVGRKVIVPGNVIQHGMEGNTGRLGATIPASASNVRVEIRTAEGAVVRVADLGPMAKGDEMWQWDGKDGSGNSLPSGNYIVKVSATMGGKTEELQPYVEARVNSVNLAGKDGVVHLNLNGMGTVSLADVREISG